MTLGASLAKEVQMRAASFLSALLLVWENKSILVVDFLSEKRRVDQIITFVLHDLMKQGQIWI